MTKAMLDTADFLVRNIPDESIIDFHELGSEGAVLRTIVPGPFRGPGTWLISRDGSAASYEGERLTRSEVKIRREMV